MYGRMILMLSVRQTDIQTDRRAHHNTALLNLRLSNGTFPAKRNAHNAKRLRTMRTLRLAGNQA